MRDHGKLRRKRDIDWEYSVSVKDGHYHPNRVMRSCVFAVK